MSDLLDVVGRGLLDVQGRLLDASNATLFCALSLDGVEEHAVYKPIAGERPLWDFPDGTLAGREVATYLISESVGLGRVPPTVMRDGPAGRGMVQLWIETNDAEPLVDVLRPDDVPDGWPVVLEAHDRYGNPVVLAHSGRAEVAELAALDVVVNNTDRKGGHVLHGDDGEVYGVDHGICLHQDPKLRTVLWGWAARPLGEEISDKLRKLSKAVDGDLGEQLAEHLTAAEVRAVAERTRVLLEAGRFPIPPPDARAVPWPLL